MTDDPRAALASALELGDNPDTALKALRHAIAWTARSIAAIPANAVDEANLEAIELVIGLDEALEQVDVLLEHVPALAERGVAGAPVTEFLRCQANALADLSDRIAVARREHEALFALEAELRACGEEHDQIQLRLAELSRLERLAKSLPAVREQHARLTRRLETMITPVAAAEQALMDTAGQVVTISAERLADLGERTKSLLAELAESEQRWADERRRNLEDEERLIAKRAEYETLRGERAERLAALRVHVEIDQDLVERLAAVGEGSSVDHLRATLAETRDALDRVDQAIGEALERYDRFVEQHRKVLPWGNEP